MSKCKEIETKFCKNKIIQTNRNKTTEELKRISHSFEIEKENKRKNAKSCLFFTLNRVKITASMIYMFRIFGSVKRLEIRITGKIDSC